MVLYSVRARIAKNVPAAMAWATDVSKYIKEKHGVDIECFGRVGAGQDVVWTMRFADMGALEKYLDAIQADSDYAAKIRETEEAGHFDTPTVEWGIWRKAS